MIHELVVKLASPAMIGGSVPRDCDHPPSLRAPSVRGQLRFWSRALGGRALEEELWGTEASGQRVRLVGSRSLDRRGLKKPVDALLIPSRNARVRMIPPGDRVHLRLAVPDTVVLPRLQAVVWTWLHLGAVGRRSRRGYGSLLWRPAQDDLLHDWPPLWPSRHLGDRGSLADYLSSGLERVGAVLGAPDGASRSPSPGRLASRDQVFVGKTLSGEWEAVGATSWPGAGSGVSLEAAVHGLNENGRGGGLERKQLGCIKPERLPSPMLWRIFPAGPQRYLPVMTWFPQGYEPGAYPQIGSSSGLYGYLNGTLGFETSLTGGALARP